MPAPRTARCPAPRIAAAPIGAFAALAGALAFAGPAWADSSDGWGGPDTSAPADSGEAEEDDKDTGCAHLATPVSGLSLLLGAALAFGLRRRA